MSRVHLSLYVDLDDVFSDIDDGDLMAEVKERGLLKQAALDLPDDSGRQDDLIRALEAKRWDDVDYLLRTYFLRTAMRGPPLIVRAQPHA